MPRKRSKPIIFATIPEADIDSEGFVSQANYLGELERLKVSVYKLKLICPCGSSRYYKPQDKKQVEQAGKCKVCLRRERLLRRKERQKRNTVREILKESL